MLAYAEGKLYERAYVLTNAADNKVAASNPPADADGNLIATGANGNERVVTTNDNTTAASPSFVPTLRAGTSSARQLSATSIANVVK